MSETSGEYDRRNFLINLFEGALFIAGASFMSAQTVIPALINRLGGGNVAVGAIGVINWLGLYLPQLFAARYSQTKIMKKPWAIRIGFYQRMIIPFMILTIFLFGELHPLITIWLFLLFFTSYQMLTGLATPFWFDMFAKLTPVGKRGRLSGARSALAGAGGFLGAILLTWLFTIFRFPVNYALAFSLAFALQIISILFQYLLVEEFPSKVISKQTAGEYFRQLRDTVRGNHSYRIFIRTLIPLTLATMPVGFFTIYGMHFFKTGESIIGQFTLMMVAGQGIGALLNGFLADRFGNKVALISAASALGCASLLAVLSPSIEIFRFVFIFVGMNLGSELMIRHNLALEYSPVEQRSTYIGLMNAAVAPFYLSSLLGGWISDIFGYPVLFIAGGIFSLAGIILIIFRVHEPRSGKH